MKPSVIDFGEILAGIRAEREARAAAEGLTLEEYEQRERERAAAKAREERELEARRHRAAVLATSGIGITPEDYARIVDGMLNPTAPLRPVKKWVEAIRAGTARTRILTLVGGVGCGKTVSAAWAVAELGGGGLRADELVQAMFPWGGEAKRPARMQALLASRGVVLLDDLGTEPPDPKFHAALGAFIDLRVSRGWTVITANLTREEFRSKYDERVMSRLNHVGRSVELGDAPSLRRNEGGF